MIGPLLVGLPTPMFGVRVGFGSRRADIASSVWTRKLAGA
jgi:hypothetical protein